MPSIDQMISNLKAIEADSLSVDERLYLVEEVRKTLHRVQSPWDRAWEHAWVRGATMAAISTLIDASVFRKWAEAGNKPITTQELADLTNADSLLLSKLIAVYTQYHFLRFL